jgi:uncharacterized alkaline shock family protein YloU
MEEREVRRVVRNAAESVYGVAAIVPPGVLDRLRARLGFGSAGVAVAIGPPLAITLDMKVAAGVPPDKVAANVAEKVRYVVERDFGQHVGPLVVRVDGEPVVQQDGTAGASPDGASRPVDSSE